MLHNSWLAHAFPFSILAEKLPILVTDTYAHRIQQGMIQLKRPNSPIMQLDCLPGLSAHTCMMGCKCFSLLIWLHSVLWLGFKKKNSTGLVVPSVVFVRTAPLQCLSVSALITLDTGRLSKWAGKRIEAASSRNPFRSHSLCPSAGLHISLDFQSVKNWAWANVCIHAKLWRQLLESVWKKHSEYSQMPEPKNQES